MFRANRARGEGVPTTPQESTASWTSVESLLALSLCAIVILASVALLRRSSDYSRVVEELQAESLRPRPQRARLPGLAPVEPRPDLVVLVSLDALRPDRLGMYGYARETAPRLRALGQEGAVFRTVAAQSSHPLTSHKSLFTGKHPATLMLEQTGADLLELSSVEDPREYLVTTFTAVRGKLAAGFRERGFRTAAFTDGPWMSRASGFDEGFGVFDDAGGGLSAILPRALAWLESNAAAPSFLFLQASDLRCPYRAHEPFEAAFCQDHAAHSALDDLCAPSGRNLSSADVTAFSDHYDAALLSADDELGRLFDGLRARGLWERALIVVTAGHGESLGERGAPGHGGLYLEQLLVPLILKLPEAWNLRPTTVDEPVELVDLLPTLFALCGIPPASDADGRSLLPTLLRGVRGRDVLAAQGALEEAPELFSSPSKRTLLRPGRWQVIHDPARPGASFFALASDPGARNGYPVAAELVQPLLDVLLERGRDERRPVLRAHREVRFSPEIEEELDRLGYASRHAAERSGGTLAGQRQASDLR